jgi:hypothetical protein
MPECYYDASKVFAQQLLVLLPDAQPRQTVIVEQVSRLDPAYVIRGYVSGTGLTGSDQPYY